MISFSQAEQLIKQPKKIMENDQLLSTKDITILSPFSQRFNLVSEIDESFTFLLEVIQGKKNHLKFTLHFMETASNYGLLRVDYNARHKNPEVANEFVVDELKPYTGVWIEESHIHYYVQGYKPLAWAIPLDDSDFLVKSLQHSNDIPRAFNAFCQAINVTTHVNIHYNQTI